MMNVGRLIIVIAMYLWSAEIYASPIILNFSGIHLNVDGEFINAVLLPENEWQFAPLFKNGQTITVSVGFDTNQPDFDPDPNTGTYASGTLLVAIPELGLFASRSSNGMQISAFNDPCGCPSFNDQFFAFVNGVDSFSSSVGLPSPTSFDGLFFGDTLMLANDKLPTSPLDWTFGNTSFDFSATDGTSRQVLLTFSPGPASVPEPSTLTLLAVGLVGLGFARRRARVNNVMGLRGKCVGRGTQRLLQRLDGPAQRGGIRG